MCAQSRSAAASLAAELGRVRRGGAASGSVVVVGHGAGAVSAGVPKPDEVRAGDVLDDGGNQGLRGYELSRATEQRGEIEDFAGANHTEAEKAPLRRPGNKFDSAAARDEDVVGGEAFADKKLVGRVTPTGAEGTEIA